ncbi:MAG: hypothetical protein ACXADH_11125 [Candidatus Kariarchaeaceae archaeon]
MTNAEAVRCSYFTPLEMDHALNYELWRETTLTREKVSEAFEQRNKFMATQPPYYTVCDSITGRRCT